ncbi:unnamed protein product [Schistosoma margrebowiei]|uniref:Uncharacterized protein n=1 Tax=Schistosoma margrebowiei TaxID=48269 RepID=A0A183LGN2_9TREM|nr:unnamed protein product [Schistosoma margrebowiei]
MSPFDIYWLPEVTTGIRGKLALFFGESEYWLAWDRLAASVGPAAEATGFIVISKALFSFEILSNSLLILSTLFYLDVELILKFKTVSSSSKYGVDPFPTLSDSKGVTERDGHLVLPSFSWWSSFN